MDPGYPAACHTQVQGQMTSSHCCLINEVAALLCYDMHKEMTAQGLCRSLMNASYTELKGCCRQRARVFGQTICYGQVRREGTAAGMVQCLSHRATFRHWSVSCHMILVPDHHSR
jgi:hypothetical protein